LEDQRGRKEFTPKQHITPSTTSFQPSKNLLDEATPLDAIFA
jgi:hypothetical protein